MELKIDSPHELFEIRAFALSRSLPHRLPNTVLRPLTYVSRFRPDLCPTTPYQLLIPNTYNIQRLTARILAGEEQYNITELLLIYNSKTKVVQYGALSRGTRPR
jgi:hypothetical protein